MGLPKRWKTPYRMQGPLMNRFVNLLLGACAAAIAAPICAQDMSPRSQIDDQEEDIVVNGERPRGSVVGDVEPETTLNGGDIRAMGVSSIAELLTELAPQLSSARGGSPVVLLEGRRISSFREIATLPAEAIQRAEILPEEVALSYGYPAEQKVLNIVLRARFKSITAEARDRIATEGGGNQVQGELGLLTIRRDNRVNITAHYQNSDILMESQRGILTADGGDTRRSLQASGEKLTLSATYARNFSQTVSGSLNGEVVTDRAFSLTGLSTVPDVDVFTRTADDLSAHLGGTLNADIGKWHATLTGNYDHAESRTISVRGQPVDLARSTSDTADADLILNGNLYRLPAGQISLTTHLGGTFDSLRSETTRSGGTTPGDLDRTTGFGSVNINLPLIKSPSAFIGKLSINGHVGYREVSDFGGLTDYGYGFNWVPQPAFRLIGSFSQTETAPTMQQLGGPVIVTPLVPIFDPVTGESVLVTRVSGSNPNLRNAERREWSLGLTVKPFTKTDLTFTVGYNRRHTENGVMGLSGLTTDIQEAFPDRFVRDADGELLRIDATPVNIARQSSSTLRWGFNFSKPLKTPQSQLDAIRAAFEKRRAEREAQGESESRRPGDDDRPRRDVGERQRGGFGGPGGDFGGGPGREGFGRGGGSRGGGRLSFAIYHTWHLEETARLRGTLPEIDLLKGGSVGGRSGQPRHEIEMQAGFSRSGIGLRASGQWESRSRVLDPSGQPVSNLYFADYAKFNLRTFVTPAQIPGMMGKYSWMRGLRISFTVDNVFNTRQSVTDGTGTTPFVYRSAYQDPLGRTLTLNVRKTFF